ncbi:MAG: hypothetical protein HY260_17670 [Chloroflexi bacterium]|nr:hypothetical protein [Chloroflexota bacterium]
MAYIAPQTHVTPLCTIRRERLLPVLGDVLVRANQKVEALDVVARAAVAPHHYVVDVGRFLGLPASKVDRYVTRKPGDDVKRGTLVAARHTALGLQSKVARAPGAGTVVSTTGGRVVIEAPREALEVRAGIPGVVVSLNPGLGVMVETAGALIQGVWGSGGLDFCVMHVLAETRNDPLRAEAVTVSHRGAIVIAGGGADAEALRKAGANRVKGIVLGSLDPDLVPLARSLDCPVMITDGFGHLAMSAPAFALIKSNAGREAALDAKPADRFEGWQPEMVIPLPAPSQSPPLPPEGEPLLPGKRVRALRAPYAGAVGTINALLEEDVEMPSGVRAPAARVDLKDIGPATIPFANLEILE